MEHGLWLPSSRLQRGVLLLVVILIRPGAVLELGLDFSFAPSLDMAMKRV